MCQAHDTRYLTLKKLFFRLFRKANPVPNFDFCVTFLLLPCKWDKNLRSSPTVGQFTYFYPPKQGWRG